MSLDTATPPAPSSIRKTEFVDSTPLLADPAALRARADEDGYLFFKRRLPADEVLALRAELLAVVDRYGWRQPGQDALGKKFKLYNDETLVEVIGVVRNVRDVELKADPAPFVFFPVRQQFTGANAIHVRIAGSATALMPTLRKELQALDPGVTLYGMITYEDIIRQALWGQRTGAALMTSTQRGHSVLPMRRAIGLPMLSPKRTPPEKLSSSSSNFIRAPRP